MATRIICFHRMDNKNEIIGNRYSVWLDQAHWDIEAAKVSLENGFYEWATFQCQQAAEKSLKAVLVFSGEKPPRLHKLAILYNMCRKANKKIRDLFIEYRDLEAFTFLARYPFLMPGENASPHNFITKKDAQQCLAQSQVIFAKIRRLLTE